MLKKFLCWLLIFQHINVYVLHARAGDLSIIFSQEEKRASGVFRSLSSRTPRSTQASLPFDSPYVSLKIAREGRNGGLEEIFGAFYKKTGDKFQKFKNAIGSLPKNLSINAGSSLGIVSSSSTRNFVISIFPDGHAHLRHLESEEGVSLETFGGIQVSVGQGKSRGLSLTGAHISNDSRLEIENLSLTTLTPNALITNIPGASLKIGNRADVHSGKFENQGKLEGGRGSVLDLHGNDFTNKRVSANASINWEGRFSILNGGKFFNEEEIVSVLGVPACSLTLDVKSFKNLGTIKASQDVSVTCRENFSNRGSIEAQNLAFKTRKSLFNAGCITSAHLLTLTVGNDFYNREGGVLSAGHLEMTVGGLTHNVGRISSRSFNIHTESLKNVGQIFSEEKGDLTAKGHIHNHRGGELGSGGMLTIASHILTNQGKGEKKEGIHAQDLHIQVSKSVINDGKIVAEKKGKLEGAAFHNRSTGVVSLPGEGDISAGILKNKGEISGGSITGTISIFKNFGQATFSILSLTLSRMLWNASTALMSALKDLLILGEGTFHNAGYIKSGKKTQIAVGRVANSGDVTSGGEVMVSTQQDFFQEATDFLNSGLFTAPSLIFQIWKGLNKGRMHAQKLVAQSTHLTNENEIIANDHGDFTGGSLKNETTGVLKLEGDGTFCLDTFRNKGEFSGHNLTGTAGVFENFKQVSFSDFILTLSQNFFNAQNSLLSAVGTLEVKGKGHVHNVGQLKSTDLIDIAVEKVTNSGIISADEDIKLSTHLGLRKGSPDFTNRGVLIAPRIDLTIGEGLNQEGTLSGVEDVRVKALRLTNRGRIASQEDMEIRATDELKNDGEIGSQGRGILTGGRLVNRRSISLREISRLAFRTIQNLQDATLSSKEGGLTLIYDALDNQGSIRGKEFVQLLGRQSTNQGTIDSNILRLMGPMPLTTEAVKEELSVAKGRPVSEWVRQESVTNSGKLEGRDSLSIAASQVTNRGSVSGYVLHLVAHILRNFKTIRSLGEIYIKAQELFKNMQDACVSSVRKLIVEGGEFSNEGRVSGDSNVTIHATKLVNKGHVISQTNIKGRSDDFENEGLMVAPTLVLSLGKGISKGPINEKIDKSKLETLRGLLAWDSLSLTATGAFTNTGHIFGRNRLTFQTDELTNQGEVISDGSMGVRATGKIINRGRIQSRGRGFLVGDSLFNEKSIVLGNTSRLSFKEIRNLQDATLSSKKGGLTLTYDDLFNEGKIDARDFVQFLGLRSKNAGNVDSYRLLVIGQLPLVRGSEEEEVSLSKRRDLSSWPLQERFKNKGTFHGTKFVTVAAQHVDNASELLSDGSMNLRMTRFDNAGEIKVKEHLSLQVDHEGRNEGEVSASQVHLAEAKFENTASGNVKATHIEGNLVTFINRGSFIGDTLELTIQMLTNAGELLSLGGKLSLFIAKHFNNLAGALLESTKELLLRGKAELHNAGKITSKGKLEIRGARLRTSGHVSSAQELDIKTAPPPGSLREEESDFENTGLVLAPHLRIHFLRALNQGPINTAINLERLEGVRGLIAIDSITLTAGEVLTNKGHVFASTKIDLRGDGRLINADEVPLPALKNTGFIEGQIESGQDIESSLKRWVNKGSVLAARDITCDGLTEDFENRGTLRADGALTLTSTSNVVNGGQLGFIQGGSVSLTARTLTNHKVIAARKGLLKLNVRTGETFNTLYGQNGIELTLHESFTNHKGEGDRKSLLKTEGFLAFRGEGVLKNHGFFNALQSIQADTDLENTGEIIAGGRVLCRNGHSFINRGMVQGKSTSIEARGDFVNEGTCHATEGKLKIDLQEGTNTGTLGGKAGTLCRVQKRLTNGGKIGSSEETKLQGAGRLYNIQGGILVGSKVLKVDLPLLHNDGHLESDHSLTLKNLRESFVNGASGSIRSKNSLSFEEVGERLPEFTNRGEISAKILSLPCMRLSISKFLNEKSFFFTEGGDLSLDIEEGENSGVVSTPGALNLQIARELKTAKDSHIEGGTVTLKGEGSVENAGNIGGTSLLTYEAGRLTNTNTGELSSAQKVEIKRDFTNEGTVVSGGTLDLHGTESSSNTGVLAGDTSVTATFNTFDNRGTMTSGAGDTTITAENGTNSGSVGAAKAVTLTVKTKFENKKEGPLEGGVRIEADTVTVNGPGAFDNKGRVHGTNLLSYEAGHLTNTGEVSSEERVDLRSSFSNLISGRITSSGSLVVQGTTSPIQNEGLLQGKEYLLYEAGHLINTGEVSSSKKVDIKRDFTNKGTIGSEGTLNLQGEASSSNTGTLSGNASITATFNKFDNLGTMGSAAGDTTVTVEDGTNFGIIGAAQKATLTVGAKFENKKEGPLEGGVRIEGDTVTVDGTGTFDNKGRVHGTSLLSYEAGHLTNTGEMSSDQQVGVKASFSNLDLGKITSLGSLTLQGTTSPIQNDGVLHGKEHLLYEAGHLTNTNTGEVSSDQKVEIKRDFTNRGTIGSKGTLALHGTVSSTNTGALAGNGGVTATFKKFDNMGTMGSAVGDTTVTVEDGTNSGIIGAAQKATLTVGTKFENKKEGPLEGGVRIEGDTVTVNGTGTFDNKGGVHGASMVAYEAGHLTNTGEVSSSKKIEIKRDFTNQGTIGSKGTLALHGTVSSTNTGALAGDRGVTATFKKFDNMGTMGSVTGDTTVTVEDGTNSGIIGAAQKATLTVGAKFENKKEGPLEGGVRIEGDTVTVNGTGTFDNKGRVHGTSLLSYEAGHLTNTGEVSSAKKIDIKKDFTNGGTIGSKGALDLHGTASSSNRGTLAGDRGITATFKKFDNMGTMGSIVGDTTVIVEDGTNSGIIGAGGAVSIVLGKKLENTKGARLEGKTVTLKGSGTFENKGTIHGVTLVSYEAGHLTNAGEVSSDQQVDVKASFSNLALGKITSLGALTLQGTTSPIQNDGVLHGKEHLLYEAGHLTNTNTGEVSSTKKVEIKREFTNRGKIVSLGTLTLQSSTPSSNSGVLAGEESLTATLKKFDNTGTLVSQAGEVLLVLGEGSTTALISAASRLRIGVGTKFTFGQASVSRGGNVEILGGESDNHGQLVSEGALKIEAKKVTNHNLIQAEKDIELKGAGTLRNTSKGAILSQTKIEADPQRDVTNEGTISSAGSIILRQTSYVNGGVLEAGGTLSFPGCRTLNNKKGATLLSKTGEIALPQLKSFTNVGSLLSHASLKLGGLSTFSHTGILSSHGSVSISGSGVLSSSGTIWGALEVGVSNPAGTFSNHGRIDSPGTVEISAKEIVNAKSIQGMKGITLTSETKLAHQKQTDSKLASAGAVKLTAQRFDIPGYIEGQPVELFSKGTSLVADTLPEALRGTLVLHSSAKGWNLNGKARKFSYDVTINGPILCPALLHSQGNLTWNLDPSPQTTNSLTNSFNITAGGLLTLKMNGSWTNRASVQGGRGASITAADFINAGSFWGAGKITVSSRKGFDNTGKFQFNGEGEFSLRESFTNHPGATFSQHNLPTGPNIVRINAGKAVRNISGVVYIEGSLESNTQLFSNELEVLPSKTGKEGVFFRWGKRSSTWLSKEFSQETPATPSSFYVGNGRIEGNIFHNLGSTFCAQNDFYFQGNLVQNWTRFYKRSGTRYSMWRSPKRWYCDPYTYYDTSYVCLAKFYATGDITLLVKGQLLTPPFASREGLIENTGEIRGRFLDAKATIIKNTGSLHPLPISKPSSLQLLSDHLLERELVGPSLWVRDKNSKTGFLINPTFPRSSPFQEIQGLLAHEISGKERQILSGSLNVCPLEGVQGSFAYEAGGRGQTSHPTVQESLDPLQFHSRQGRASEDSQEIVLRERRSTSQDLFTVACAMITGKHPLALLEKGQKARLPRQQGEDSSPLLSWDLEKSRDYLANTPSAFLKVPPRIAVLGDKQDLVGQPLMHMDPLFSADLLQRRFLNSIGFASPFRNISAPLLLLRILEEEGYVSARKSHGLHPEAAPKEWEKMTPQQQLMNQLREFITEAEMNTWEGPAVVYKLMYDHGALVLSALSYLPKKFLERFSPAMGRMLINAASMRATNIVIENGSMKATEGDLHMVAEESAEMRNGHGEAAGNMMIEAGRTVTIGAVSDSFSTTHTEGRTTTRTQTDEVYLSSLQAGGNMQISAGKQLTLAGLDARAKGKIDLFSAGTLEDRGTYRSYFVETTTAKRRGILGGYSQTTDIQVTQTFIPNTYVDSAFSAVANGSLTMTAPHIQSKTTATVQSKEGRVKVKTGTSFKASRTQKTSKNLVFQRQQDKGETHETVVAAQIQAPGGVEISGGKGVQAEVKGVGALEHSLDWAEQESGRGWIKTLRKQPGTIWSLKREDHDEWNRKSSSLTPGAAAVVALAVAVATQGLGSSLITTALGAAEMGGMGGAIVGTMADAFATGITARSAIVVLGSCGNADQFMEEMGSSNTLKDVGLMTLTAGATRGLGQAVGAASNGLKATAVQAGVSVGLRAAMHPRENLGQMALQGVTSAVATSAGALAANKIGEMYAQGTGSLSYLEHKGLHAVVGAGLGSASNLQDPLRGAAGGAAGAVVAEVSAEALQHSLGDTWKKSTYGTIGKFSGTLAGWAAGDANAGSLTAVSAMENNFGLNPSSDPKVEEARAKASVENGKRLAAAAAAGTEWLVVDRDHLVEARQRVITAGLRDEIQLLASSQDPRLSWWERLAYQERASEAFDRALDAHVLPTNRLDQLMGAVEVGGLLIHSVKIGQLGKGVQSSRGFNILKPALKEGPGTTSLLRATAAVERGGAKAFQGGVHPTGMGPAIEPSTLPTSFITSEEARANAMAALYKEAALQQPLLTKSAYESNAGGYIKSFVTTKDDVYYRVYSQNREGNFLTKIPPQSRALAREGLALPPTNTAMYIQEVLVPSGTRLQRSRALPVPAFGRRGGMEQFELIDEIPRINFKEGKFLE